MSKNVFDEIRPYIPETIENMLSFPQHRLLRYFDGTEVPTMSAHIISKYREGGDLPSGVVGRIRINGQDVDVRNRRGETPAAAINRVRSRHS